MTHCTRCEGTGFLNIHQIEDQSIIEAGHEFILKWIKNNNNHDVCICDCCGNTEIWYGVPGQHYSNNDPIGREGPYGYNGGLCECH